MDSVLKGWTRYVDDTFTFIEPGTTQDVLQKLNSYDPKIQFTFETENNRTIPFLDVLIRRTRDNQLETTVYRKKDQQRNLHELELALSPILENWDPKESHTKSSNDMLTT